jgi:RNA ligase (TIGR02306 family)
MSSLTVTVERLSILPHPNADALELAAVGGYRAVVRLGQYRTGDLALYIPEQAIVPDELLEELGLAGRLGGSRHNRVTAVRLRGELSQGIVCSPMALSSGDLEEAFSTGADLADRLGITKWVPEVPVHFGGEVLASPDFQPWIDIENIKRYPDVFAGGEEIEATEKVHGTAGCFTWTEASGLLVSSKGLGSKHLTLVDTPENIYWRCAREHDLESLCKDVAQRYNASSVSLFGEVYGKGVQDLSYAHATNAVGFALFDARIVNEDSPAGRWLERDELAPVARDGGVNVVPVLYRGPYDYAALLALSNGPETISGTTAHTREGLVLRAIPERRSDVFGSRAIAKLVGSDYLTRKGGTEYE